MIARFNLSNSNDEGGIKGLVEAYKAHGVIDTGDFVKFATDYSKTNEVKDTALNLYKAENISAIVLSNEKVFIAYSDKENNRRLAGIVCTIKGTTITTGTKISLSSSTVYYGGDKSISTVALSENKVFISYGVGSSTWLNGIVCTISGTSITKGTETQLSSTANTGAVISAVKLDGGKVFIAHSYGSNYYLYGIVCTISGTTITKGADTALNQNRTACYSAVALDNNKVFIAYSHGSDKGLYLQAYEISGTTITVIGYNNTFMFKIGLGNAVSAVKLNENKVFIAYTGNDDCILNGMVCAISNTTITVGTDTVLNLTSNTGKIISAVALNENKVLITHTDSNGYLYSMLCDVNGDTITKGTDILLSSVTEHYVFKISTIALAGNKAFIATTHIQGNNGVDNGNNVYLYGMIQEYFLALAQAVKTKNETINGVAISSAQDGEMVQVKVPRKRIKTKEMIKIEYISNCSKLPRSFKFRNGNRFCSN